MVGDDSEVIGTVSVHVIVFAGPNNGEGLTLSLTIACFNICKGSTAITEDMGILG